MAASGGHWKSGGFVASSKAPVTPGRLQAGDQGYDPISHRAGTLIGIEQLKDRGQVRNFWKMRTEKGKEFYAKFADVISPPRRA